MQLNTETNELTPTTAGNFIHRTGTDHDYYSRITLAPSEVADYTEHFHEVPPPEWREEHEPKDPETESESEQ